MPCSIRLVATLAVLFGLWTEITVAQQHYVYPYSPVVIESSKQTCPSQEDREAVRDDIAWNVQRLLTLHDKTCGGTGGWALLTHINMSNASHQCPGNYRQVTREGLRLCARDTATGPTTYLRCQSVFFSTNNSTYRAVCGRVTGYQYGGNAAFEPYTSAGSTIEERYVDGVILSHGEVGLKEHIWTFASARGGNYHWGNCLCSPQPPQEDNDLPPPFVGENYFCEAGRASGWPGYVFVNQPLWDGEGCSAGSTCCDFNDPPYFTRQLQGSTTDDIEFRICSGQPYNFQYPNDVLIGLIELYIK